MKMTKTVTRFFGPNRTVFNASAPGRLDVMGGIADYSGSLVLQYPIQEQTTVYLALRQDGWLRAHSASARRLEAQEEVQISLPSLKNKQGQIDYSFARKALAEILRNEWSAYVFGCPLVLIQEKGIEFNGADFWIESQVPIGKGVSSSAALETSTLTALAQALRLSLGPTELPILAQKVENRIVGAPCGLMDQLASYLGEKGKLLPILCRPDQIDPALDIPQNLYFIGVDSGVRHAVSGASYGDVRTAAFMGYTLIALHEGARKKDLRQAKESGDASALPYGGYLTHIPPSLFEIRYRPLLPPTIRGDEFQKRYGTTIDAVTRIQPEREYAVNACATHPIYEHHRVQFFALLLQTLNAPGLTASSRQTYYEMMGELMFQSHVSYSQCGLGNSVTDELVEAARAAGAKHGVYGAKITGGGCGGTVCFFCVGQKGVAAVKEIARRIAIKYGFDPVLFQGSSHGARRLGVKILKT